MQIARPRVGRSTVEIRKGSEQRLQSQIETASSRTTQSQPEPEIPVLQCLQGPLAGFSGPSLRVCPLPPPEPATLVGPQHGLAGKSQKAAKAASSCFIRSFVSQPLYRIYNAEKFSSLSNEQAPTEQKPAPTKENSETMPHSFTGTMQSPSETNPFQDESSHRPTSQRPYRTLVPNDNLRQLVADLAPMT